MTDKELEHTYSGKESSNNSEDKIYRNNTNNHNSPMATNNMNDGDRNDMLQRVQTAGSLSISPELFEKLYLTPQSQVKGDLRKTFGNPTPLALLGFIMSLTPLSMDLMGWRGAGGGGAANIGGFYFIGGLMMVLGGILEFFLGNTFPFVVFTCFGGFWFSYGATLTPAFAAAASYATTANPVGAATTGFNATFGFYLLCWTLLVFVFLICSLRTNVVFFIVFLSLDLAFALLTGAYFALARGHAHLGTTLVKGGGGCGFVTSLAGWFIFIAQMLAALDFPFQIPVGDLSGLIQSGSSRAQQGKGTGDEV